ncbi:MAG: hypothetical protein QOI26_105, partial [Pseudonocardiales bacterium]|nr:hypothetical protein [Pseudonocardiales bacterium]
TRAALGRFGNGASWAQWESQSLRVNSPHPLVPAGVDGEATLLSAPLEFESLAGRLRVLVPANLAPPDGRSRGAPGPSQMWAVALGH